MCYRPAEGLRGVVIWPGFVYNLIKCSRVCVADSQGIDDRQKVGPLGLEVEVAEVNLCEKCF